MNRVLIIQNIFDKASLSYSRIRLIKTFDVWIVLNNDIDLTHISTTELIKELGWKARDFVIKTEL